jgi:sensor c-di-GMP phosphodiesterase-like protein
LSRGLAGLANGLGLSTVAEGVETAEQATMLAGQGWQFGQGWFFGKPAPDLR